MRGGCGGPRVRRSPDAVAWRRKASRWGGGCGCPEARASWWACGRSARSCLASFDSCGAVRQTVTVHDRAMPRLPAVRDQRVRIVGRGG